MRWWLTHAVISGVGFGFLIAAAEDLGFAAAAARGVFFGVGVATVSSLLNLWKRSAKRSAKPS